MGSEHTLLHGFTAGTPLRRGPFIQVIRGEKDPGRDFYKHGQGHQLDFGKVWPSPMSGSTNIRWHRLTIYMWRAHHYGTAADLDRGWSMIEGALDQHSHQVTEPWAGGAYGQWNAGCCRAVHALAELVGHPLAARLRAYDLQGLAGYGLVAQSQPPAEATDWRTPFGEPRAPKAGGGWSTTATHTRAYISPASRNQEPPADIYFNLVPYGDMLRRLLTGAGSAPEFIRETCDALDAVQTGLSKPFAGGPEEQAIHDCMAGRGLGPILGWFKYPLATRFRFVRFEDGAVLSYAESSTNAGSTFFNGAGYQAADGGRKWTGACIHPSYRSFGQQVLTEHTGRTVRSWLPDGVSDPRMIPEFEIEVTDAPVQYDVLVRRDGKAIDRAGGGGQPPSPPPPDEDSPTVDLVDFFFPSEMAGKHLKRSDGPGYTAHWRDDEAQCGAHIKHRDGDPIDFFAWTGSRMLLVLTEHGPEGGGGWGNARNYKRHVPGNNVWWPRFIPAGEKVELRTTIHDTGYVIAEDCVEGGRLDLRTGATLVSGPYSAAELGVAKGDIPPDTECYVFEWIWNDGQVIETFTLARGIGKVRWKNNRGLGGHVHDLIQDGAPEEPNFPCLDLRAESRRIRALPPASEAPPPERDKPSGCRSLFILLVSLAGILASAIVWALM